MSRGTSGAADGAPASGAPRTLAEELRGRSDESLAELLRVRPDLVSPVPADLTQLATRLSTRASVVRALERLDRFTLQVAEALAVAPDPCGTDELAALMAAAEDPDTAARLPEAVATLRAQALLWGGPERLHLVRTVREALDGGPGGGTGPTGLGPVYAEAGAGLPPSRLQEILADSGLPPTPDAVSALAALAARFVPDKPGGGPAAAGAALLASAPEGVRGVLHKLTWETPFGQTPARPVRAADARTPVEWLQARGVLLPSGRDSVVLPREAALHLRGGRAHREQHPLPPEVAVRAEPGREAVDQAAAAQAFTAVRTVEELLDLWSTEPPPTLRAGGLGVRDLRRTATLLELTVEQTAFWIELAYGAGLLAPDGEVEERWAPTPGYDEWLRRPPAERWAALARGWLAATRVSGLVGTKDSKEKVLAALGPGLDRATAPELRRALLERLAELPPGAAADRMALAERLTWERPLRGAQLRPRLIEWTLAEAEELGVTGRGALASPARPLLAGDDPSALLAPLLPEPLNEVILQPDLTAIAPGPLETPLAQTLAVAADVESKGGATVYRFTPESVRRALDAGRSAAELHAFLGQHSRTPVPQPLSYLIDDVARRHGRLRVGAASAYLRCDDDALLTELLADRRASGLRLRRLAPTVLAAQTEPGPLLQQLRTLGYAPAAESAEGDVLITRPDAHRTPPRSAPVPVLDGPPPVTAPLLTAAVRSIRAGDRAATAAPGAGAGVGGGGAGVGAGTGAGAPALPRTSSAETLAVLQTAVLTSSQVWIGYVNAEGAASQRVIEPVRVEGGFVTAYDPLHDNVQTFSLHRITGAAEVDAD